MSSVAAPEISGSGTMSGLAPGAGLSSQQTGAPPPPPPVATKAPSEAKPPSSIRVGGNVLEARIVRRIIPEYPKLARDMRISGRVHLLGTIGRDGSVKDLKVIDGHPLLVNAAVSAVRQWLYTPTLLNNEPVEVIAPIEVNFTLGN